MVDLRFANSLQIMLSVAHAEGELVTSVQLSEGLQSNPALIRKLLVPLAQAGLIETFKGKTGGARLAKAPKQISLREIYEAAVDSELVCGREKFNTGCSVGTCMNKVFGTVVEGMETASLKFLEGISLEKLLNQVRG